MSTKITAAKGLAAAHELTEDRQKRLKELKAEGKKIIGYFCCSAVPVEFFTALGLVPQRIMGNAQEPISKADAYLETMMCPFIRSCVDLSFKGQYDLLDGLVGAHTCDSMQRIFDIWKYYHHPGYSHFVDMPHVVRPAALKFYKKQLDAFKKSLEVYAGKEMSLADLVRAIKLHNENRELLRKLYDLRKQEPPLISGAEVIEVVLAGVVLPVEEHSKLVKEVITEVTARKQPRKHGARVLIVGSEINDVTFIKLVESCNANVVMDDLCTGSRSFWHDVELTADPLDGLVGRYLEKTPCPRTFRDFPGSSQKDIENRFRYIKEFCRDFKVNAAILYIMRFCDTHELDAPDIKAYLESMGLPVLHLEDDYSASTTGQLKTRVEAFLELLG